MPLFIPFKISHLGGQGQPHVPEYEHWDQGGKKLGSIRLARCLMEDNTDRTKFKAENPKFSPGRGDTSISGSARSRRRRREV